MAHELTTNEWIEILNNPEITKEIDLSIFQALYSFEGHKAYASQVGILLGYKGKSPHAPLNSEIGRYAKRIAKFYDIEFSKRTAQKFKFWDLFFNGWDEGQYFVWELKANIAEALKISELTEELFYAEEILLKEIVLLPEGSKKSVAVNIYERHSKAKHLCVQHWKAICCVCNFNFESRYGNIGKGYIHVHHLIPVSQIGKSYMLNPVEDLRPICPNCHSMLHTRNPPLSIEELKEKILKGFLEN